MRPLMAKGTRTKKMRMIHQRKRPTSKADGNAGSQKKRTITGSLSCVIATLERPYYITYGLSWKGQHFMR